jgi:hypothetical protein
VRRNRARSLVSASLRPWRKAEVPARKMNAGATKCVIQRVRKMPGVGPPAEDPSKRGRGQLPSVTSRRRAQCQSTERVRCGPLHGWLVRVLLWMRRPFLFSKYGTPFVCGIHKKSDGLPTDLSSAKKSHPRAAVPNEMPVSRRLRPWGVFALTTSGQTRGHLLKSLGTQRRARKLRVRHKESNGPERECGHHAGCRNRQHPCPDDSLGNAPAHSGKTGS